MKIEEYTISILDRLSSLENPYKLVPLGLFSDMLIEEVKKENLVMKITWFAGR